MEFAGLYEPVVARDHQTESRLEFVASVQGGVLWRCICGFLSEVEVFEDVPLLSKTLLSNLSGFPLRLDAILDHAIPLRNLQMRPHWSPWKITGIRLDAGDAESISFDALDLRSLLALALHNLKPTKVGALERVLDGCRNLQDLHLDFRGELPADEAACIRLVSLLHDRLGRYESFETNLLDLPGPSRGMIRVAWTVATYEHRRNAKASLAAIEPLLHAPRAPNPFMTPNPFATTDEDEAALGLIPRSSRFAQDHLNYHRHERELLNALLETCIMHGRTFKHLPDAVRQGSDAILFGVQLALKFAQSELQRARADGTFETGSADAVARMAREDALIQGRFSDIGASLDASLSNSVPLPADIKRPHQAPPRVAQRSRHAFRRISQARDPADAARAAADPGDRDEGHSFARDDRGRGPARDEDRERSPPRRLHGGSSSVASLASSVEARAWTDLSVENEENNARVANREGLRVQVPVDSLRGRSALFSPTSVSSTPAVASSPMLSLQIPAYGPASSRSSSLGRTMASLPAHLRSPQYTEMLVRHIWADFVQRLSPPELPNLVYHTRTICHTPRGVHVLEVISLMVSDLVFRAARDADAARHITIPACELIADLAELDPNFPQFSSPSGLVDCLLEIVNPGMLVDGRTGATYKGPVHFARAVAVCKALCHVPHLLLSSSRVFAPVLAFLVSRAERVVLEDEATPELAQCAASEARAQRFAAHDLIHIVQTLTILVLECDAAQDVSRILVPRTLALVFEVGHQYVHASPEGAREISFRILDSFVYLHEIGAVGLASCVHLVDFYFSVLPDLPDEYILDALDLGAALVFEDDRLLDAWLEAVDHIVRKPNPESAKYPAVVAKVFALMGNLVQDVNEGFGTACQCLIFIFSSALDTNVDMETLDIVLYYFQELLKLFYDELLLDSRERLCAALSSALLSAARLIDLQAGPPAHQLSHRIHTTLAWCTRCDEEE